MLTKCAWQFILSSNSGLGQARKNRRNSDVGIGPKDNFSAAEDKEIKKNITLI